LSGALKAPVTGRRVWARC